MAFRILILAFVFSVAAPDSEAALSFRKVAGNILLHVPSGITFPSRIGSFNRERIEYYDSSGRDVSVRYVAGDYGLLDAYVYPAAGRGGAKQEFARQQSDIRRLSENVRLLSETEIQTNQAGRLLHGKRAIYDLVRTHGLLRITHPIRCGSEFVLFEDGRWFVACRISYPLDRSSTATKQVDQFVSHWKWRQG